MAIGDWKSYPLNLEGGFPLTTRIGINGFGRIGRLVLRRLMAESDAFQVVGVNDLADTTILATLFKYDSVHGRYPGSVERDADHLIVDGKKIKAMAIRDPAMLPWRELAAEIVLESTGVFAAHGNEGSPGYASHFAAGARKVLLTATPRDSKAPTIVRGVNDDQLQPDHSCIAAGSGPTNALAPVAKVLHEQFGIVRGWATILQAQNTVQRPLDALHRDPYYARAAAVNLIACPDGAVQSVGLVLPELRGKLAGTVVRVPVAAGSMIDLTVETTRPVVSDEVNAAVRQAAEGLLRGILAYTEDPVVSRDVVGDSHSALFAADCTGVLGENLLKVIIYYDNEWGYSCRCVDMIQRLALM